MVREIAEEVAKRAQEIMGDEFECTVNEKRANNGDIQMQVTVRKNGASLAPSITIQQMMEDMDGEIDDVAHKVAEIAEREFEKGMPDLQVNDFSSPEYIKENCFIAMINADKNKEIEDGAVCQKFLDLLAVVRVKAGQCGSFLLKNEILKAYGLEADEVIEAAKKNTRPGFEAIRMTDMLAEMGGCSQFDDGGLMEVCSNKDRLYGAAFMLYEDLLEEVAERKNDDLYIIPSSIHELICVPVGGAGDMGVDYLHQMVCEVNATQVAPDEVLADSLYMYSREDHQIRKVA